MNHFSPFVTSFTLSHLAVIDCGEPEPSPGAAYIFPEQGRQTTVGSTFTFNCPRPYNVAGHSSLGNNIVQCGQSGVWEFNTLHCEGMLYETVN